LQIARALRAHPGRVTVFVPHFAMSGGTLVALGADEIVMSEHAMLGPIDPQINGLPAASIIKVAAEKPLSEIDDSTLIFADLGHKAIAQLKRQACELLRAPMTPEAAVALAEKLTSGRWTHDYPISVAEARELGLPVSTDMPQDMLDLLELFPQPLRASQGVEFGPQQPNAGRN
jgi:ClpP class serine protease